MKREQYDVTKLVKENRRLRETVETLLDELEASEDTATKQPLEHDGETTGSTTDTGMDMERVRSKLPDPPSENPEERIDPPWERENFESKQAWLEAKRGEEDEES